MSLTQKSQRPSGPTRKPGRRIARKQAARRRHQRGGRAGNGGALGSRRTAVVAGVIAAVVCLLFVMIVAMRGGIGATFGPLFASKGHEHGGYFPSTGVLGDADGNGYLSSKEKAELVQTQHTEARLTQSIFASKGVTTRLITPPGQDWWNLVTSIASADRLYYTQAPTGVNWYAVTEGRAFASGQAAKPIHGVRTASRKLTYQAVFVEFKNQAAYDAWAADAATHLTGTYHVMMRRPSTSKAITAGKADTLPVLVTLVPDWVSTAIEPFKPVQDADRRFGNLKVAEGIWSIDFKQWITQRAQSTADAKAYEKLWASWGFGDPSTGALSNISWTATSRDPRGDWKGHLGGFAPAPVRANVDVEKAILDMRTATHKDICDQIDFGGAIDTNRKPLTVEQATDCAPRNALSIIGSFLTVWDRNGHSFGDEQYIDVPLAKSAFEEISMTPDFQSLLQGDGLHYTPALERQLMVISADGQWLTIRNQMADAPTEKFPTAVRTVKPIEPGPDGQPTVSVAPAPYPGGKLPPIRVGPSPTAPGYLPAPTPSDAPSSMLTPSAGKTLGSPDIGGGKK